MKRYVYVALASALLGGCASLEGELESIKYPPDMAVLINNTPYLINSTKCSEIRSIGQNLELNCHDAEGNKSAKITPISNWRRNYVEEKMGFAWASPEHQAFIFEFVHNGGMEKSAEQIGGAMLQSYSTAKGFSDMLDKQAEIDKRSAKMSIEGTNAYISGGMPAWQKHQSNVIKWRLDNSRYFSDQLTAPVLIK